MSKKGEQAEPLSLRTSSLSVKVSAGVETGSSDWYIFFSKQLQIFEARGYWKCA